MVFRMESRETVVAGGTVEEYRVTSDPFGLKHTQEQIATELAVELCCSHKGVNTISADIKGQVARGRGVDRTKFLVRVSCQDRPSGSFRRTFKNDLNSVIF